MLRCAKTILILLALALVATSWRATAQELPECHALEAHGPDGAVLALSPSRGEVLLLRPVAEAPTRFTWTTVVGAGAGPGGVDRPSEADARLGLQVLILDTGRRAVNQYTRELSFLGREDLPAGLDLARPDLLAVSAGRTLVAADSRAGRIAVKRPGERWSLLLDYSRSGALRLRSLETVGERIYLLDQSGDPPRLLMGGTEGGWLLSREEPGLLALHRGGPRELLLLRSVADSLVLESWPEAAFLDRLPAQGGPLLAAFVAPPDLAAHPPRDFVWLPWEQDPGLLLARSGAPALWLTPLDGPP
jgi:hypothetical protein